MAARKSGKKKRAEANSLKKAAALEAATQHAHQNGTKSGADLEKKKSDIALKVAEAKQKQKEQEEAAAAFGAPGGDGGGGGIKILDSLAPGSEGISSIYPPVVEMEVEVLEPMTEEDSVEDEEIYPPVVEEVLEPMSEEDSVEDGEKTGEEAEVKKDESNSQIEADDQSLSEAADNLNSLAEDLENESLSDSAENLNGVAAELEQASLIERQRLSAFKDLSEMYLRQRADSESRRMVYGVPSGQEEVEAQDATAAANPKPDTKPSSPLGPDEPAYTPKVGDEVMTQFGRGEVAEVRGSGAEATLMVKTTEWRMALDQPATLYLQPAAVGPAPPKKSYQMTTDDKLRKARALKDEGAGRFREKDYAGAQALYFQCVGYLRYIGEETTSAQRAEVNELLLPCYNNMALCLLRLGRHQDAVVAASNALLLSDALQASANSVAVLRELARRGVGEDTLFVRWPLKSLGLLGKALLKQNEYDRAVEHLERGVALAGRAAGAAAQEKEMADLLKRAKAHRAKAKKAQKKMWAKSFKKNAALPAEEGAAAAAGGTAAAAPAAGRRRAGGPGAGAGKGAAGDSQPAAAGRELAAAGGGKEGKFWTANRKVGAALLAAGAGIGLAVYLVHRNSSKKSAQSFSSIVGNLRGGGTGQK